MFILFISLLTWLITIRSRSLAVVGRLYRSLVALALPGSARVARVAIVLLVCILVVCVMVIHSHFLWFVNLYIYSYN